MNERQYLCIVYKLWKWIVGTQTVLTLDPYLISKCIHLKETELGVSKSSRHGSDLAHCRVSSWIFLLYLVESFLTLDSGGLCYCPY